MEGDWQDFKPATTDAGRIMKVGDVYELDRSRVPEYFNEFYAACLALWQDYRLFGSPTGGGWAQWPARLVDVLRTCEIENRRRSKK